MKKQLSKETWLKLFELYESNRSKKYFKFQFEKISNKKFSNNRFSWFKKKYKLYNSGMSNLISQTGKSPKKGKGSGRPKKRKEINWDEFTREDLIEIAKQYVEIIDDIDKKEAKKSSENLEISVTKKTKIFNKSRSSFYKKVKSKNDDADNFIDKIILDSFEENDGIYGRRRLSVYIMKKHNIYINPRTLGRKMNKLNLKTTTRTKRKSKQLELKNTSTNYQNIVNRDYNDLNNRNIFATDVTYIKSPKDVDQNHVFFSAVINHKTKKIISWNLSKSNDTNLVLKHIEDLKKINKNFIIHSDHGVQYSSLMYEKSIKEINGEISMSRVGNSLDNREVEYFFSNLKSECLYNFDMSKITYEQLRNIINDYVNWYNNFRIQSVLNWKTPSEAWRCQS